MFNPISKHGRIDSFDGWRAVAILLVLLNHCASTSGFPFPDDDSPWSLIFDGRLGVRIFFVLSGFLITTLLLREAGATGRISLRDFYLRRVFRIFPIYFSYLGVLGALAVAGYYHDIAGSWIGALTFTRNMTGTVMSATGHLWSLAVEEQFYVVWPVLLVSLGLWKRDRLLLGVLALPILACPVLRYGYIHDHVAAGLLDRVLGSDSILAYADSLAVGCMGAWMAWRLPGENRWKPVHGVLLGAALLLIVLGRLSQVAFPGKLAPALVPAVQAWAILVCLWMCASPSAPLHRFLNSRAMVVLGVLSYSIYIWHFLFISRFMGPRFAHGLLFDWRVWYVPALALSAVSYRYLEMPLINLRKRFRHER